MKLRQEGRGSGMQAGQMYLFRITNAMTMKWLDLGISGSACHMGLLSRDGIPLPVSPRLTDHIALTSANRCHPHSHRQGPGMQPPGPLRSCCREHRLGMWGEMQRQLAASGCSAGPQTCITIAGGGCTASTRQS